MRSLKTRGLEEIESLLNRVNRSYGMRRINTEDAKYLDKRCREIAQKLETLDERLDGTAEV